MAGIAQFAHYRAGALAVFRGQLGSAGNIFAFKAEPFPSEAGTSTVATDIGASVRVPGSLFVSVHIAGAEVDVEGGKACEPGKREIGVGSAHPYVLDVHSEARTAAYGSE